MIKIVKSAGATRTERQLAELCEQSFLKLWSYPNPVKDDGKELCDLIAVFENDVFIFFDRESSTFDGFEKDHATIWRRWKRNVIDAQIRTVRGAERYVRSGRDIFLDVSRNTLFPIPIDRSKITVHNIVVAHGAMEACKRASRENVYGSLAICYGSQINGMPSFPFMIDLDKSLLVHVFDTHNLSIILNELDTIFDFTSYLTAKGRAISRCDCLTYCGEEDLLANYFVNFDTESNRHFIGANENEKYNFIAIGEGEWKNFVTSDVYRRKKEADKISYLWDSIIQKTAANALAGKLLGTSNPFLGQSAIHEMAKEPRFSRRALAEHMIAAIKSFPISDAPFMRYLSFMPSFFEDVGYVFLQVKAENMTDRPSDYRAKRQALLEIACGAAKNKFGHLNKVVGIAIEPPKISRTVSEDFILLNCADWPPHLRKHYEDANKGFNFFATSQLEMRLKHVSEFPAPQ